MNNQHYADESAGINENATKRVYTPEQKARGASKVRACIGYVKRERDGVRLLVKYALSEMREGRKVSGNFLSYMGRHAEIVAYDGTDMSASNNHNSAFARMLRLQWPEYAHLICIAPCVLDDEDVAPMIPPIGELIDIDKLDIDNPDIDNPDID